MRRVVIAIVVLAHGWGCIGAVAQTAISRDQRLESKLEQSQLMEWSESGQAVETSEVRDVFVTLTVFDFVILGDGAYYSAGSRYCIGSCTFLAGLPVPHGATIVGLEIDACDDDGDGSILLRVVRVIGNEGGLQPEELGRVIAEPSCFYSYAPLDPPHVVDQYLDNYVVLVDLTEGNNFDRFQAVRVYYRSGDGEIVPTGTEPSLFP